MNWEFLWGLWGNVTETRSKAFDTETESEAFDTETRSEAFDTETESEAFDFMGVIFFLGF